MVGATISRARDAIWRVWAAPGPAVRPDGRPPDPSASRAQPAFDAASIGGPGHAPQSGQLAPRDLRSHGTNHLAVVEDGLDVVAVRIGEIGAVVAGVVLGSLARLTE